MGEEQRGAEVLQLHPTIDRVVIDVDEKISLVSNERIWLLQEQ